jgi:hypothetical protein
MSPRALAERQGVAKGLLANHCFVNAMIGIALTLSDVVSAITFVRHLRHDQI